MFSRRAPRGFTLVELMAVLAITAIVAALGLNALGKANERSALAEASFTLKGALKSMRRYADSNGQDVVLVVLGSGGAASAQLCDPARSATDPNCVRLYVLLDLVNAASTRFDAAALLAFDPTTIDATTGLTAQGDRLLETHQLPRYIHLGAPGSPALPASAASAAASAGSGAFVLDQLDLTKNCTFCVSGAGAKWRGYLRFTATGELRLDDAQAASPGAVFVLEHARRNSRAAVAVLPPAGVVTDRIGRPLP